MLPGCHFLEVFSSNSSTFALGCQTGNLTKTRFCGSFDILMIEKGKVPGGFRGNRSGDKEAHRILWKSPFFLKLQTQFKFDLTE